MPLVVVSLLTSGAEASNSSSVKDLGIEVHFTQCTHMEGEAVEDAQFCGDETWVHRVSADGWTSEHENVVQGITNRWTAACRAGVYRAEIDGRAWPGTCGVTGDQDHLCFQSRSTTGPGDYGGEQTQCFDLSGDACRMDLQGKVWLNGAGGEILTRYAVSSRDVTACRILGQ